VHDVPCGYALCGPGNVACMGIHPHMVDGWLIGLPARKGGLLPPQQAEWSTLRRLHGVVPRPGTCSVAQASARLGVGVYALTYAYPYTARCSNKVVSESIVQQNKNAFPLCSPISISRQAFADTTTGLRLASRSALFFSAHPPKSPSISKHKQSTAPPRTRTRAHIVRHAVNTNTYIVHCT